MKNLNKGLHKPIISEDIFTAVQQKKKTNPAAQLHPNDTLLNYYHNILYCKNCGHQLRRRVIANSGHEYMLCTHRECRGKIVSSTIEAVDEAAISAFRYRINQLEKLKISGKTEIKNEPDKKAPLIAELEKSKRQLSKLYDLLEQEIYDTNTFIERSKIVNEKIHALEAAIKEIDSKQNIPQLAPDEAIRRLEYVIEDFADSDPEEKNRLLHTIVRRLYYHKTQKMCRNKTDSDLTLNADFL